MKRQVTFQTGGLSLEGVFHVVESGPTPAAAICHPHPLHGGDMNNAVVVAVCDALSVRGIAALRFNFRGVGGSLGSHSGGLDERFDACAALDFLASQPNIDAERLCLAGYSFGALVALSTEYHPVVAAAAISPPFLMSASGAPRASCPTLLVFGQRDTIAPATGAEGMDLPPGSRIAIIPGADHFWWGHEEEAAAEVAAFFCDRTRVYS